MSFKKIVLKKAEEVENLCNSFEYLDAVAVDVEGCEILEDKFHPVGRSRLFSVQFCVNETEAYYIPTFRLGNMDYSKNMLAMKPFIESKKRQKVLHNANYDFCVFYNEGMNPSGLLCDTLIAEYTAFNDNKTSDGKRVERGLKPLCEKYFGMTLPDYEETFTERTGKNKRTKILQNLIDVQNTIGGEDTIVDYAVKDPWLTLKLFEHVKRRLSNQEWLAKSRAGKSMWDYLQEFEIPFQEALLRIEWRGLPMNREKLWNIDTHYQAEQVRLEEVWRDTLKQYNAPENLSHKGEDLIEFLTKYVGITLAKLTQSSGKENKRTGEINEDKYAVDKKVLEELHHPVADLILDIRKVEGGLQRYIPQLKQYYNTHFGKAHSSINRTGTRTGRLSTNNLNFQNLPSRNELAEHVNKMFEAPEGYEIGEIDADQVEVRFMGYLANDKATKKMILEELDPYIFTGSEVDDTIRKWFAGREVTKQLCLEAKKLFKPQRDAMKVIRLGYQYGMGVGKTATALRCSMEKAKQTYNGYWNLHSGIRKFSDAAGRFAQENGYVLDILGRRIWISGVNYENDNKDLQNGIRAKAQRQAANSRVQGSVSSWFMLLMTLLDTDEELAKDGVVMLRQVHDSITFMAPKGALEKHKARIDSIVSEPLWHYEGIRLSMPTPASLGYGKTIYEAKKNA